jgi:hypothetical protein
MAEPFTIRFFVPNGNPDQILLVDRLNWTGLGIKFSRLYWEEVNKRPEFSKPGIYILIEDQESELPRLYIGLAENLHIRINQHTKQKDFWDWGVAFSSSNGSLNRGHLSWLEYALIQKARKAHRSLLELDNNQTPSETSLSESDKADTQAFLKEILQILPLINLRVFEEPKPIVPISSLQGKATTDEIDTIVVPAQEEGFKRVFLGEDCWWAVRIASHIRQKLRFIAAYQTSPVSAITHYASIKLIEPFGNEGKYKIIFSEKATEIERIPLGNAPKGTMQGPRYTSLAKLKVARAVTEL